MPESRTRHNIKKAVRQHAEMEEFFVGDFTIADKQNIRNGGNTGAVTDGQKTDNSDSLEAIAQRTRSCRLCELSSSRSSAVPGEGSWRARIMFVGEAPGAEEDRQGRPFVGRAGQLLDKIIAAMGLKRSDVFICNILKCRPPENRDPRPEEIIKCLPYLQEQIELIKPEIIVALGAHAARALLDTNKPVGQLRGQFQQYYPAPLAEPIKLMPTYHPAYLLRNYSSENRLRVWMDMQKVMAQLGMEVPGSAKG